MLGWEIMIERGANRQPFEVPSIGQLVASWRTGLGGTDWLERLVKSGHAIDLGGNGYPCRYALSVGVLLETLKTGTPAGKGAFAIGDDYYLPSNWTGSSYLELELLQAADPLEILVVEAWDQS